METVRPQFIMFTDGDDSSIINTTHIMSIDWGSSNREIAVNMINDEVREFYYPDITMAKKIFDAVKTALGCVVVKITL